MPTTVVTHAGIPTSARLAAVTLAAVAPVTTGSFKVSFAGVTTAALNGPTVTGTDVTWSMNTAYGSTVVVPDDAGATVNGGGMVLIFVGALGSAPVTTPAIVDDTTDGGVTVTVAATGVAPVPTGTLGDYLYNTDADPWVAYEYVPTDDAAPSPAQWLRAWPTATSEMILWGDEPASGRLGDFYLGTAGTITTGTFKLSFEGVTTAELDGVALTPTTCAAAMNAAYGPVVTSGAGDTVTTPNDAGFRVVYVGALGSRPVTTPTVVDDTTDGGVNTSDGIIGFPPAPPGATGQFLYNTAVDPWVGYQYLPTGETPTLLPARWQVI